MTKNFYRVVIFVLGCFCNSLCMEGPIVDYEELRKNSSKCTLFGINLLEELNGVITTLEKNKDKLEQEAYQKELILLDKYVGDVEMDLVKNSFYDGIEKSKQYTVKSRKNFFSLKKRKVAYVSEFVWDATIKEIEKSKDENHKIGSDGSIMSSNVFHATILFDTITQKREQIHKKQAFQSFAIPPKKKIIQ